MPDTDTSIYSQIRYPDANYVPNALLALAGAQRQQTALDADQMALGIAHLTAAHQAVAALASNPNATVDDAHQQLGNLVMSGVLRPDEAAQYGRQIEATRNNPAAFRNLLANHLGSLQSAPDQFRATYGTPDVQDLGDNRLTRTVSPTMGVRTLARDATTLTPQDKATRITGYQNGQPGSVPTAGVADRYGLPIKAPIGGAQGSGAGSGAPAAMAPAGFMPSGASLGQAAMAEGSAGQYLGDLRSAAGSGGEISNLQSALGNVQGLGATGSGPGTAGRNRIASFLNSAGLGSLPGVDPKRIESFDSALGFLQSAQKSGTLNPAPGQAPGAGAPTTPSLDVSQPAAVNLLRAQIALKRMQAAQVRSYPNPDNGTNYAPHAADFAGKQDPRAFAFDTLSPTEQKALVQGLGPKGSPAYTKFNSSLKTAVGLGLMSPPASPSNAGQP